MNAPHSAEHVVLGDDAQKVTYKADAKMPDKGTFVVTQEDHTLGNIMRCELLRDPRLVYSGYRMPHPLENTVHVTVRARAGFNPIIAWHDSLRNLTTELQTMETVFKVAVKKHQSS